MSHDLDPQVTSSIIATSGGIISSLIAAISGIIAGTMGTLFGLRKRTAARSAQDQRCERICNQMLRMGETMVAVFRVSGQNDPALAPYLSQMETAMAEARAYLSEGAA